MIPCGGTRAIDVTRMDQVIQITGSEQELRHLLRSRNVDSSNTLALLVTGARLCCRIFPDGLEFYIEGSGPDVLRIFGKLNAGESRLLMSQQVRRPARVDRNVMGHLMAPWDS
ncbi:MAG: hypothetical protein HY336_02405 [Candidatus Doudnabacteria bacterium]|nr:hypothetical protein [Candidatus Doudnabacteria bacterium]